MRAMATTPTDGKVSFESHPVCEHCFTCHVGPLETDIQEKEQKESQKANKTKHGMERTKSKVIQVKKIQLEGL
ncbi:hypothetical protein Tco_0426072 [Tanacetum coccineum]